MNLYNLNHEVLILLLFAFSVFLLVLVNRVSIPHHWKFLITLVITFEGLSVSLLASKIPWFIGVLISLVGFYYLYMLRETWKRNHDYFETIASGIIKKASFEGRLIPFFSLIGFSLAVIDVVFATWYSNGYLGQIDNLILVNAFVWMSYNYVPNSYAKERDFLFIFMNLMTISFVLPSIIWSTFLVESGNNGEVNYYGSDLISMLLVKPLEKILSLFGFVVWSESDMLYYQDLESGTTKGVWVAKMCSGLYSVLIFTCAFISVVMIEFEKLNQKSVVLMFLGIFTSYIANLFRMAIIVAVGHYYGSDALYWTHANLGWVIFTIWVGIFWAVMFKYLATDSILYEGQKKVVFK